MDNKQNFLRQLRRLCGDMLISDPPSLKVYETDGLTAKKRLPWLVVIPDSIALTREIVQLCAEFSVPIVARGAGTGLSGGAMPHDEGVLLSLAKFSGILDIDQENHLARVEPGVTNLAISQAVAHLGLYYAPDPSSQIACTIGGNVAENSGGVHCLKYGLTLHNVLGLKLISPQGEFYRLGGNTMDNAGLDLLALLHGSEGMLGIITEVTVKLLVKPPAVCVVMAAFDSVSVAATGVSRIIASGILPAGLEMMDKLAIKAAEDFVHAGYPTDAAALILCELDGDEQELRVQHKQLIGILDDAGAKQTTTAWDESERQQLWQGRKAAFPAVGRLAPDYYCMDGTIPRRELPATLEAIASYADEYQLAVANVFHAGDGNLHPLILYDANDSDQLARAEAFGARILELCIARGGTVTGEHGVGVEKLDQMCIQFTTDELALLHGIKRSFDAQGILNPGKAVPTLSRCAEFGAMHVHSDRPPHPHLQRF